MENLSCLADCANSVAFDEMGAHHLVADLQEILGVEELRHLLEERISDAFGLWVQKARLA